MHHVRATIISFDISDCKSIHSQTRHYYNPITLDFWNTLAGTLSGADTATSANIIKQRKQDSNPQTPTPITSRVKIIKHNNQTNIQAINPTHVVTLKRRTISHPWTGSCPEPIHPPTSAPRNVPGSRELFNGLNMLPDAPTTAKKKKKKERRGITFRHLASSAAS